MTSLDLVVAQARQDFEAKHNSLDLRSADGITYDNGRTLLLWAAYRDGYIQATARFQASFIGHVYVKDEEYARLVAGQAK